MYAVQSVRAFLRHFWRKFELFKLDSVIKTRDDETLSINLLRHTGKPGEHLLQNLLTCSHMNWPKYSTDLMFNFTFPSTTNEATVASKVNFVEILDRGLHAKQKADGGLFPSIVMIANVSNSLGLVKT